MPRIQLRLSSRPGMYLAAGLIVATTGLAACGGSSSTSGATKGANADATAACAALARSTPVGAGSIPLYFRLRGAAELGLAAVGENGSTYDNLSGALTNIFNDVNGDKVSALSGDVSSALALCQGDSLPH